MLVALCPTLLCAGRFVKFVSPPQNEHYCMDATDGSYFVSSGMGDVVKVSYTA